MTDFPWNYVYAIFAEAVVKKGLGTKEMRAKMFAVFVEGERIQHMQEVPVAHFFNDVKGKDRLGEIIRTSLAQCADDAPFCLVLMSEAYAKVTRDLTDDEIERTEQEGLSTDPEASEVVMIQIHRKHENRMALLPIMPDRSVKHAPLMSGEGSGRFASNGADESFRDFVKRHEGAKK